MSRATGKQRSVGANRWRVAVAAGVALGLGVVLPAGANEPDREPTRQEMLEQLKALQAKLEKLEANQQAQQDKLDSRQVDATIDSVLKDAERRSQLIAAEGFTAGYTDGKFLIQSADGKFVLNPNLQFQYRYILNSRQESKNGVAESDDVQEGFEVRRLKFSLDGNVFSKDTTYKFQWATSRTNGTLVLDEGWVRHKFAGTPFAVRVGSQANGWNQEAAISSKRQLAVERSALHDIIAGGTQGRNFVQGVQVSYDAGGPIRGWAMYHDGFNSRNTNFTNTGGGSAALGLNNPQGGVSARVEYKVDGDWKQYDDFTSLGNKKDLLVVGAGGDIDWANNLTAYFHTVDAQWEPSALEGLSLYAAYVGVLRDFRNVTAGTESPYDWGFLVQAGYLLNDQWEVFARYDYTDLDAEAPGGTGTLGAGATIEDKVHELTVGVNYYLKSHAAKFTVDVTYLPNGSPFDLSGAGILAQPSSNDQLLLRAQFQLLL